MTGEKRRVTALTELPEAAIRQMAHVQQNTEPARFVAERKSAIGEALAGHAASRQCVFKIPYGVYHAHALRVHALKLRRVTVQRFRTLDG